MYEKDELICTFCVMCALLHQSILSTFFLSVYVYKCKPGNAGQLPLNAMAAYMDMLH